LAWESPSGCPTYLTIPLKVTGAVVGGIGFASYRSHREWPDELVQRLRLVGDIFTNALARKRAEEALQRATQQAVLLRAELAHATRLELLSHLTTSIAHEVNQPLCAMASNAQTALDLLDMGEIEEAKNALQDIWGDARRGSEIIGRIRGMVKKEVPCPSPVRLASVIEELTPLLSREAAARGVELRIDLDAKDLTVVCDRVQLQQVVLNLLLNAVEAVSHSSIGPPRVWIRAWEEHPEWGHVSVEDTGVGLSTKQCEEVFAPFYTTKAKGLGMGLSISRSLLAAQGGSLWATPGAEHGTTFHLRLPVAPREQP
jgi:C4-dicarboxylate-specific signal transduction histidine kinase